MPSFRPPNSSSCSRSCSTAPDNPRHPQPPSGRFRSPACWKTLSSALPTPQLPPFYAPQPPRSTTYPQTDAPIGTTAPDALPFAANLGVQWYQPMAVKQSLYPAVYPQPPCSPLDDGPSLRAFRRGGYPVEAIAPTVTDRTRPLPVAVIRQAPSTNTIVQRIFAPSRASLRRRRCAPGNQSRGRVLALSPCLRPPRGLRREKRADAGSAHSEAEALHAGPLAGFGYGVPGSSAVLGGRSCGKSGEYGSGQRPGGGRGGFVEPSGGCPGRSAAAGAGGPRAWALPRRGNSRC